MKKPLVSIIVASLLISASGTTVFATTYQKYHSSLPAKHHETPVKHHTIVHTSPKYISGFVVFYDDGTSQKEWTRNAGLFNEVYIDSATIRPDGSVDNETPSIARQIAQQHKQNAQICVSNYGQRDFDAHELQTILEKPKLSQELVTNLAKMVKNTPYSGINIDFEQSPQADSQRFVSFLSALHIALHKEHKSLSVDVPAKTMDDTWDGGYDYTGIGKNSDEVLIMAYDYSYPGGQAGPIAPVGWVKSVLQYSVHYIPVSKIRLGLPVYGYDWHGNTTDDLTLLQVNNIIAKHKLKPLWDATDQVPYFTYQDASTGKNTVYYENAASINAKLRVAKQFHVPGVFTWYVGSDDTGTWNNIRLYRPH
jgi:spore germination protein YaaH